MFSYLIVALFALLSVDSRPLERAVSVAPCSLPTANHSLTPSFVPSTPPSLPTPTDDCSEPTTTTPVPPTSSAPPPTSAAPTTSVVSTPATSSAASTPALLTTVSDVSSGTYTGGIATYYYQNGNPGACGQYNSDDAFICAMDQTRFGTNGPSSPLCGQKVQITNLNTGGSITVTIADDCPTCENENSIDLSVGAFSALASLSQGEFPIRWSYA